MWILGLKGLKPGMPDLLLYKYNEKSCFFVFFFFFFYQVVGCCGTYTVDSRMDTCIRQIRKTVGNMKVLVSTVCHKLCLIVYKIEEHTGNRLVSFYGTMLIEQILQLAWLSCILAYFVEEVHVPSSATCQRREGLGSTENQANVHLGLLHFSNSLIIYKKYKGINV